MEVKNKNRKSQRYMTVTISNRNTWLINILLNIVSYETISRVVFYSLYFHTKSCSKDKLLKQTHSSNSACYALFTECFLVDYMDKSITAVFSLIVTSA